MFALLALLISSVSAGELKAKTSKPLHLAYTNAGVLSEYTFCFQVEKGTTEKSVLRVEAPEGSYRKGLGGNSCTAVVGKGESRRCWVKDWTIYVSIGELSNSPVDNTYSVSISPVPNPTAAGVTGFFRLSTWTGINLLDFNDYFAQAGIAPSFTPVSDATLGCLRSCLSGDYDEYQLKVTIPVKVPMDARITLRFAEAFVWDAARGCRSSEFPSLLCTQSSATELRLSGFRDFLPPASTVTVTFPNVLNPYSAGQRGNVQIEFLEASVNTLITRKTDIAGPRILPNSLSVVSVCPNGGFKCASTDPYVTLASKIEFTIVVQTTNDVPKDGAVRLTFGASFGAVEANTCVVLSGLTATSGDLACVVDPLSKTATVSHIAQFPSGQFSLRIRLTTPSSQPASFTVSTYSDSSLTSVIDSTLSPATIPIASMTRITDLALTWTPVTARPTTLEAQGKVSLAVDVNPGASLNMPCTVKLRFPSEFSLPTAALLIASTAKVDTVSVTIVARTDPLLNTVEIDLTTPLTTLTPGSYTHVVLSDSLTLPQAPGQYAIEATLAQSGTDIQSYLYWVSIVPQVFSSPKSVVNLSKDVSAKTVYEFIFTPTVSVPASAGSAIYGEIEFSFPVTQSTDPLLLWASDLGTGLMTKGEIPCRAMLGIVPLTGTEIVCSLTPSTASSIPAIVTVSNFLPIAPSTEIRINLVSITNIRLTGAAGVMVSTYSKLQTYANPLNQETMQVPAAWDTSLSPPLTNGRSAPPDGDGENKVEFLPNSLRAPTLMRFLFWPEKDIPNVSTKAGSALFIQFPLTYPLPATGVQCMINYKDAIPCYTVPKAGWIVVSGLATGFTAHSEYPFDITGLTNPRHRIPRANLFITCVVDYKESEYLKFVDFPLLDLGVISPAVVTADNYEAAHIDTTYFIVFTPQSELEAQAKIVVTLPKNSYVTTTTPQLECLLSGLAPAYGTHTTCVYRSNTVEITGFGSRPGNSPIIVKLKHVLNPVEVGLTDFFALESFSSAGFLVDANYEVVGILINSKHPIAKLRHIASWCDPSNGRMVTDANVAIVPTVSLPAGATIEVYFPQAEFPKLPEIAECRIAGGLETMLSCDTAGSVLRIVTDSSYTYQPQAEVPINITLEWVTNFTPGVTSGPVFVQIQYSGIVVNESPQDESNRKMQSDLEPALMNAESPVFAPSTAAESAVYNMTFHPTLDFTTNCSFSLAFSATFPRRLSPFVRCFSRAISLSSTGEVQCTVWRRTVTLFPDKPYVRSEFPTLDVSIARVINPDFAKQIGAVAGFTKCGTYIIDYVSFATTAQTTALPSAVVFSSTSVSTHETGTLSSLSLATTASIRLEPADQLLIGFPPDYDLSFVESSLRCKSQAEVACVVLANCVSMWPYQSGTAVSDYAVELVGVENPWEARETAYITFAVLRGGNSTVVAKTVPNLQVLSSLSYETVGQEIRINGNRVWTQQRGTLSEFIYIYLQTGCPIPFSISPLVIPEGVSIVPATVSFGLGDVSARFQVRVESTVRRGNYAVSWETAGYWKRKVYAPVRRMKLEVVASSPARIEVASVDVVPQGGISFPVLVRLSLSPATELLLTPIKLGSKPTKLLFVPPSLSFSAGDTVQSFLIEVDQSSKGDIGEYFLYQSGVDAAAFTLNQTVFEFNVGDFGAESCKVTDFRAVNVTRTTAQFRFTANVDIALTWMLALYGTREPTIDELRAQKFEDSVVRRPLFGVTRECVKRQEDAWDYEVSIGGLQTSTHYVLFLAGTSDTERTELQACELRTAKQFRPAYATLRFRQDRLGTGEKEILLNALGEALMLNQTRTSIVDLEKYPSTLIPEEEEDAPIHTTTDDSGRSLSSVSLYHLLIVFESGDAMPLTPFQYLSSLNNNLLSLRKVFPTFDDSIFIRAKQLASKVPSFRLAPRLGLVTNTTVTVSDFQLDASGSYFVCLTRETVNRKQPSSRQIYDGVDSGNRACEQTKTAGGGEFLTEVQFLGLQTGTIYWAYATVGNDVPGLPDLLEDREVVGIGFMTTENLAPVAETAAGGVSLLLALALI